ncbi:pyridoxal-phosphate-dependent aminotransferase family protein [Garciella nitratireducens]|uniref:Aspartate aminotransferase n=1 Tax=Garciella nitratireducens DSM 15102 TaxID=1121911 RepID=A0A1T4NRN3_9FIRM|nr:alanine--glyoxylate aminotransferase family protein [Garciella nitratireducens]RBP44759.1 L-aspartate aminotransferase /phosphoserine aminotransferase [Garciella nitratireducens]SJZ81930.1 aspartate aminotransferase [Garciella nitratireducens DSM 15102]
MFKEYQHLRIPGPTPVSPEVQRAMDRTILGHRSGAFSEIFAQTCEKAKYVFQTKEDVFILASTGTGALEAAVANVVEPNDKVLVLVTGVFGERFVKIAKAYGANVMTLKFDLGTTAKPETVKEVLQQNPDIKAVFLTHCETSTAVVNPVEKIGNIVKDTDALLIVDSVSALVGMDLKMDDWDVDIAVTASHKAIGLPPGLALVCVSQKAWKVIEKHKGPKFYFDLLAYRKKIKDRTTPYTGPVSLVYGLSKSLDLIKEEGLENGFKRHQLIRDMVRAAVKALNLELFVQEEEAASCTVTAIKGNNQLDVEQLRKILREDYKVEVAGGQQDLKGKIFRIGHLGYIHPLDILTTISALEMALKQIGYPISLGAGIKAAEEVWCNDKNIG